MLIREIFSHEMSINDSKQEVKHIKLLFFTLTFYQIIFFP